MLNKVKQILTGEQLPKFEMDVEYYNEDADQTFIPRARDGDSLEIEYEWAPETTFHANRSLYRKKMKQGIIQRTE